MINKIVILGAGKSGVGAAILGKKKGYDVFVSDKKDIDENLKDFLPYATSTLHHSVAVPH